MILELDCGNSFIKWRVIESGNDACVAAGAVDGAEQLLAALAVETAISVRHCRLVSVRSDEETQSLVQSLRVAFAIEPICAVPMRRQGGVVNGYADYARLGLDRWLAVLSGYHLAQSACLVVDLGTAVTADFVDAEGVHQGGFICPGMPLMRDQLGMHTRRIRYDRSAAAEAQQLLEPGRSTAEAVERGCLLMLRAFVAAQYVDAGVRFPQGVQVFLTGGDAELVRDLVPDAQVVPDLVFMGLAIACPIA